MWEAGVFFVLLVVEVLGGWSEEAINTIRCVGRMQGQRQGTLPSEATRHLFQRLAISLWRGNATLWLNHRPTLSPEVDGMI